MRTLVPIAGMVALLLCAATRSPPPPKCMIAAYEGQPDGCVIPCDTEPVNCGGGTTSTFPEPGRCCDCGTPGPGCGSCANAGTVSVMIRKVYCDDRECQVGEKQGTECYWDDVGDPPFASPQVGQVSGTICNTSTYCVGRPVWP